jgi:hypothetical protein
MRKTFPSVGNKARKKIFGIAPHVGIVIFRQNKRSGGVLQKKMQYARLRAAYERRDAIGNEM